MLERIFPFIAAPKAKINPAAEDTDQKLYKKFKLKALGQGFYHGLGFSSLSAGLQDRSLFEEAPYDFEQIIKAIDTDSYVKQAFSKYKDLFWKEGWNIVGENNDAVNYLYQRLDLAEEAIQIPFNEFLVDAVDSLLKFSNVFIVKAYGSLDPFFSVSKRNDGKSILGFYLIPTEKVIIKRDKHNRPLKYRQRLDDTSAFNSNLQEPEWDASEVIHLYLDRKPGHIFGTPFLISALDDILSLRQVEQDVLNLVHRELFPLYKYKVGTETAPAQPEELTDAAAELENLRVEGGLILPERHDVEVIGAESNALDIQEYLKHFKERVAVGLGLSPHHLGMLNNGGNRAMTDRLDVALYDRVKQFQRFFEERMRLHIFNPLLREGGFRPITSPQYEGDSDRCYMKFREIDHDTQIKQDQATVNLFANNVIDLDETRMRLGETGELNPNLLLMTMQAALQTAQQIEAVKAQATYMPPAPPTVKTATGATKVVPQPKKPDAIPSSTGVVPNMPNNKKDTGNKVRPSNQFGRRLSPNIRRSANDTVYPITEELLSDIVDLFNEEE